MKLIVGLGNPGEKYGGTRHNLGFMVLDHFLKDFQSINNKQWSEDKKIKGLTSILEWQPKHGRLEKILLLKPLTYMNNSGMAVRLAADYFKIDPSDIWILNDELDLPLGSMKIRLGGAAAGHKGVESILQALGTDKFWRFRLGVGGSRNHSEIAKHIVTNVDEFVLGNFSGKERTEMKKLIKHGSKALQTALEKGIEVAQNRFNTK